MPTFRIVYHTAGGAFRRELEAPDATAAEQQAWDSLNTDPIRYTSEKTTILIRPAFVSGISVETEAVTEEESRAGLLGSRRG